MYVIGTGTLSPSIDARGPWFAGTKIKIINNGFILGRGGNGGRMSPNESISGTDGGTAIASNTTITTAVDNYGTVAGGGGGSCGMWYLATVSFYTYGGGFRSGFLFGGCGGRPLGLGSEASNHSFAGATSTKINGNTATLFAPGTTNSINMTTAISGSSSGGNLGEDSFVQGTQGSVRSNNNGRAGFISEGSVIINNKGGGLIYGRSS